MTPYPARDRHHDRDQLRNLAWLLRYSNKYKVANITGLLWENFTFSLPVTTCPEAVMVHFWADL
jgi:hypothetical protein